MTPIALAKSLESAYRDYLQTTFHFRDPELQTAFADALANENLTKGPFVEATPVFKRGATPRTIFGDLLEREPEPPFLDALLADRPLYVHQERAIRAAAAGGNVVVATGTGSGKTESFVYPILQHLYQQHQAGSLGPGVRALVLYPMNALANDQRERLGDIAQRLKQAGSSFCFTFGQYIGDTPEDVRDARRHGRDREGRRMAGELIFRTEMREQPPHILLTNYSMLEYLLLRPDDQALFDGERGSTWQFLVLDEVHQYRGAKGAEMAMLLRRLKQRLRRGGRSGRFVCIATSASLGEGDADRQQVARFASDLFGERFEADAIVTGTTEPIPEASAESLMPADYTALYECLSNSDQPSSIMKVLGEKVAVELASLESPELAIGRILCRDARAAELRRNVTGKAWESARLAARTFPELPAEAADESLGTLIALLLRTKDATSGAPLLSARYHVFLRALEGLFVSFLPTKRVRLDRTTEDPDGAFFEVALCRECGQHYFIGMIDRSKHKWVEAVRDLSSNERGVQYMRPVANTPLEVEPEDADDGRATEPAPTDGLRLCLRCGTIDRGRCTCGHGETIEVVEERSTAARQRAEADGTGLSRCGVCGYTTGGRGPVREVIYGADGPHAVIATSLAKGLPAERRKILAFADGRQEAAFFAWYLQDSYASVQSRNLLLFAAKRLQEPADHGLSLRDLTSGIQEQLHEQEIAPANASALEVKRQAMRIAYRELLTEERRISLEGVGSVAWHLRLPPSLEVPNLLYSPPWSLTREEANDLIVVLLDTLRQDGAVEVPDGGVGLGWGNLDLQRQQIGHRIGGGGARTRAWDGPQTRRVDFLIRILERQGGKEDKQAAIDCLREIWNAIDRTDRLARSPQERLLVAANDARRLNLDWYRLFVVTGGSILRCDTCGRLSNISIHGVCPRRRCSGTLAEVPVSELPQNHYRALYSERLPERLRVEEHTAQLSSERAREFQGDFKNGNIQVLSCSTTFEVGVDLGDLDVVFLRNVPPEAFNYAQRVGRAGRRSGYPGLAVTYCRRVPHDLYHFAEPRRILAGRTRPPTIGLSNRKIVLRHVAAAALSLFFRANPERFGTVSEFCRDLASPTGVKDFRVFSLQQLPLLRETLKEIVPADLAAVIGLDDDTWLEQVAGGRDSRLGEESRLSLAEASLATDYSTVVELEQIASTGGNYRQARWAQLRAKTIAQESLLAFLSRKAVIPKYGFPVDVVELDTHAIYGSASGQEVALQRDLTIAVSEFAPSSQLIANKKLWTSYGLKRVAEREWPRRHYKRCREHQMFVQWSDGEEEPPLPCGDKEVPFTYLVPSFGFVTDQTVVPGEPRSRPSRNFGSRPFFVRSVRDEQPPPDVYGLVGVQPVSPGVMVVLSEGRRGAGFWICGACGAAFTKREREHKSPLGRPCRGVLENYSLGHEFVTDVLKLEFQRHSAAWIEGLSQDWMSSALGYALMEGAAEVLEVPSSDLNSTVAASSTGQSLPPVVLYDNVPGGAGIVARLQSPDVLRAAVNSAAERLRRCDCGENTSCYGCLRSFRNQFAHPYLQRGPTLRFLDAVLSKWR